jgi:hypothetical protein
MFNITYVECTARLVPAAIFLKPAFVCNLLGVSPVPNEDFILHLCCLLIVCFGIIYYRASTDFEKHKHDIEVGCICMTLVFLLGVLDVMLGYVNWPILLVLSGDLFFSILFFKALQDLNNAAKTK